MTFVAIIPAGGAGTRLWPLSRRHHPKFLLDLTGSGSSLLRSTVDRLDSLADETLIVTGAAHAEAVAAQSGLPETAIITEPSGRNSLPAIALASAIAARRYGEDVLVGSFAADHVIENEDSFDDAVLTALTCAEDGYITTIGITPTHAATGFGYIKLGSELELSAAETPDSKPELAIAATMLAQTSLHVTGPHPIAPPLPAYRASQFVEKPDAQRASAYLESGEFVWNAGMFVMRADVLARHLRSLMPDFADHIEALAQAWDSEDRQDALAEHWDALEAIAIDHAIAEPVAADGGVAVVPAPADLGWDDLGDMAALRQHLDVDVSEHAFALDSPGALVVDHRTGDDLPVVIAKGIENVVVTLTDDAILITTADQAQGVGEIPKLLAERGRADLA
ncbi:mannose-1-phosphate guanylyltransferase [Bowdeniella nasicola]|uniref:Mannose-1-phosphate guanylyltransferase n=1 Tax=Bowdeniella nasicola TaxID=208480 RepID=A0A1H3YYP4_9ACTO|nr:sugar phosphate nucleotidyltransferase [Bowdeniella nasicola]SEA16550.1 mannose-1-phosphate guanylyltransferase [Bowdeniella nasicola]